MERNMQSFAIYSLTQKVYVIFSPPQHRNP